MRLDIYILGGVKVVSLNSTKRKRKLWRCGVSETHSSMNLKCCKRLLGYKSNRCRKKMRSLKIANKARVFTVGVGPDGQFWNPKYSRPDFPIERVKLI